LLQRIVGVYELDVDTAGAVKKEGKIKAISHPLALKARLMESERIEAILRNQKLDRNQKVLESVLYDNQLLSLLKVELRLIMSKVLV
jgi:putative membrane protein